MSFEKICPRCHRVCFSEAQFVDHECFDASARLDALLDFCFDMMVERAVEKWDGTLYGEKRPVRLPGEDE